MLLQALEYAFVALVIIFVITQMIIPLGRGTLLFPLFRRERQLEQELQKAKQEAVEAELEQKIEEARRKMEETRRQGGA